MDRDAVFKENKKFLSEFLRAYKHETGSPLKEDLARKLIKTMISLGKLPLIRDLEGSIDEDYLNSCVFDLSSWMRRDGKNLPFALPKKLSKEEKDALIPSKSQFYLCPMTSFDVPQGVSINKAERRQIVQESLRNAGFSCRLHFYSCCLIEKRLVEYADCIYFGCRQFKFTTTSPLEESFSITCQFIGDVKHPGVWEIPFGETPKIIPNLVHYSVDAKVLNSCVFLEKTHNTSGPSVVVEANPSAIQPSNNNFKIFDIFETNKDLIYKLFHMHGGERTSLSDVVGTLVRVDKLLPSNSTSENSRVFSQYVSSLEHWLISKDMISPLSPEKLSEQDDSTCENDWSEGSINEEKPEAFFDSIFEENRDLIAKVLREKEYESKVKLTFSLLKLVMGALYDHLRLDKLRPPTKIMLPETVKYSSCLRKWILNNVESLTIEEPPGHKESVETGKFQVFEDNLPQIYEVLKCFSFVPGKSNLSYLIQSRVIMALLNDKQFPKCKSNDADSLKLFDEYCKLFCEWIEQLDENDEMFVVLAPQKVEPSIEASSIKATELDHSYIATGNHITTERPPIETFIDQKCAEDSGETVKNHISIKRSRVENIKSITTNTQPSATKRVYKKRATSKETIAPGVKNFDFKLAKNKMAGTVEDGNNLQDVVIVLTPPKDTLSLNCVSTAKKKGVLKVKKRVGVNLKKTPLVSPTAIPTTHNVTPATHTVTPVTHTVTPVTHSVTPAMHTVTPATQTVTPATQTVTPATHTVTPATHTVTPVTHTVTPVTRTVTRLTRVPRTVTRVARTVTPLTCNVTHVTPTATPVTHNVTHVTPTATHVTPTVTPVTCNVTHVTPTVTPVTRNVIPVARNVTPVTRNVIHVARNVTPVIPAVTPVTRTMTPVARSVTPRTRNVTHVTPAVTPLTRNVTHLTPTATPVTHNVTHVTPTVTPVTHNITHVTPTVTPVTRNVTHVTPAVTPLTRNVTPVTPTVTPLTRNVTHVTPAVTPLTRNVTYVTPAVTPLTRNVTHVTPTVTPVTRNVTHVTPLLLPKIVASDAPEVSSSSGSTPDQSNTQSILKDPPDILDNMKEDEVSSTNDATHFTSDKSLSNEQVPLTKSSRFFLLPVNTSLNTTVYRLAQPSVSTRIVRNISLNNFESPCNLSYQSITTSSPKCSRETILRDQKCIYVQRPQVIERQVTLKRTLIDTETENPPLKKTLRDSVNSFLISKEDQIILFQLLLLSSIDSYEDLNVPSMYEIVHVLSACKLLPDFNPFEKPRWAGYLVNWLRTAGLHHFLAIISYKKSTERLKLSKMSCDMKKEVFSFFTSCSGLISKQLAEYKFMPDFKGSEYTLESIVRLLLVVRDLQKDGLKRFYLKHQYCLKLLIEWIESEENVLFENPDIFKGAEEKEGPSFRSLLHRDFEAHDEVILETLRINGFVHGKPLQYVQCQKVILMLHTKKCVSLENRTLVPYLMYKCVFVFWKWVKKHRLWLRSIKSPDEGKSLNNDTTVKKALSSLNTVDLTTEFEKDDCSLALATKEGEEKGSSLYEKVVTKKLPSSINTTDFTTDPEKDHSALVLATQNEENETSLADKLIEKKLPSSINTTDLTTKLEDGSALVLVAKKCEENETSLADNMTDIKLLNSVDTVDLTTEPEKDDPALVLAAKKGEENGTSLADKMIGLTSVDAVALTTEPEKDDPALVLAAKKGEENGTSLADKVIGLTSVDAVALTTELEKDDPALVLAAKKGEESGTSLADKMIGLTSVDAVALTREPKKDDPALVLAAKKGEETGTSLADNMTDIKLLTSADTIDLTTEPEKDNSTLVLITKNVEEKRESQQKLSIDELKFIEESVNASNELGDYVQYPYRRTLCCMYSKLQVKCLLLEPRFNGTLFLDTTIAPVAKNKMDTNEIFYHAGVVFLSHNIAPVVEILSSEFSSSVLADCLGNFFIFEHGSPFSKVNKIVLNCSKAVLLGVCDVFVQGGLNKYLKDTFSAVNLKRANSLSCVRSVQVCLFQFSSMIFRKLETLKLNQKLKYFTMNSFFKMASCLNLLMLEKEFTKFITVLLTGKGQNISLNYLEGFNLQSRFSNDPFPPLSCMRTFYDDFIDVSCSIHLNSPYFLHFKSIFSDVCETVKHLDNVMVKGSCGVTNELFSPEVAHYFVDSIMPLAPLFSGIFGSVQSYPTTGVVSHWFKILEENNCLSGSEIPLVEWLTLMKNQTFSQVKKISCSKLK